MRLSNWPSFSRIAFPTFSVLWFVWFGSSTRGKSIQWTVHHFYPAWNTSTAVQLDCFCADVCGQQRMNHTDCVSGNFFFPKSPIGQMFYSYCEISQDLLDRMAHALLQIFMILRRWIIIALLILICSSIANIGVEILGFAAYVQSFISFDAPLASKIYIYILLLFIHCHHLVKIPMCPMLWFIIRYLHLVVLNLFVHKTFGEIPNNLVLYWILIFKMILPLTTCSKSFDIKLQIQRNLLDSRLVETIWTLI